MQTIILAGGFGTRLRSVVKDKPKVLAEVAGKPFLHLLINYLKREGVSSFIFSLGYLHEQVEDFLIQNFSELDYVVEVEDEPLGTGGAIKLCLQHCKGKNVLVANGDTFFDLRIRDMLFFHEKQLADCTVALTPCFRFDRYGSVLLGEFSRIEEFVEKQYCEYGLINTGLIFLNVNKMKKEMARFIEPFAFEADLISKSLRSLLIFGFVAEDYFIDIGIPEDFSKAQTNAHLVNLL